MKYKTAIIMVVTTAFLAVGLGASGLVGESLYRSIQPLRDLVRPVIDEVRGRKSIQEQLDQYTERRLTPAFQRAGVSYPPAEVVFAAFKDDDRLELYARDEGGSWTFIKPYPVRAASGTLGPKLREGDRQVPDVESKRVE